jgi:hypothetical protein
MRGPWIIIVRWQSPYLLADSQTLLWLHPVERGKKHRQRGKHHRRSARVRTLGPEEFRRPTALELPSPQDGLP